MVPISGRLLVASPMLLDPNFARTVVLMLAHGDEGALGLVLNRPSDVDVGQVLPDTWRRVSPEPPRAVRGRAGRVGLGDWARAGAGRDRRRLRRDGGCRRHGRSREGARGDRRRRRDTRVSSPGTRGGVRGSSKESSRCRAGSWSTRSRADAFTTDPDELWRTVLKRQPGRLSWLANFPDSLMAN